MPNIELEFISKHHYGCCLHFSMALFQLMKKAGMEAYISITLEANPVTFEITDRHVSVYYVVNNKGFIADPVEEIKSGKGDFSSIPIEKYLKEHGTIWIYDPYGEHGDELFFETFLNYPLDTFKG